MAIKLNRLLYVGIATTTISIKLLYYKPIIKNYKYQFRCIDRFGDYAWFRKLNSNNSLSIVDGNSSLEDNQDKEHLPNSVCSLSNDDAWNFEKFVLFNSTILDAYFLPLSTCINRNSKCKEQNGFWQRFANNWSTTSTKKKLKHKQMKAKVNQRKHVPEGR